MHAIQNEAFKISATTFVICLIEVVGLFTYIFFISFRIIYRISEIVAFIIYIVYSSIMILLIYLCKISRKCTNASITPKKQQKLKVNNQRSTGVARNFDWEDLREDFGGLGGGGKLEKLVTLF